MAMLGHRVRTSSKEIDETRAREENTIQADTARSHPGTQIDSHCQEDSHSTRASTGVY